MSVKKRTDRDKVRWRARYFGPDGREHSKTFDRKDDADRWETAQKQAAQLGQWVDPASGRLTVGDWGEKWLATKKSKKRRTYTGYESQWRLHVEPRWGPVPLNRIRHEDVAAWIAELVDSGMGVSNVRQSHQALRNMLAFAVRSNRLGVNPALDIELPRIVSREPRFLTHAEVDALAATAGDHYAALIYFLAYTGCRWGEAIAITRSNVDLLRARVTIATTLVEDHGRLLPDTAKNHTRRVVPIPRFLGDMLTTRIANLGTADLVFTTVGGYVLRNSNFRKNVFIPAREKAGLDGVTPHDLRHTAASLAIAAGASVKAVQKMLGHKTATMTLDLYGHLYEDELDALAGRLHDARTEEVRDAPVVRIKE